MEIIRRCLLLVGICLAIWLTYLASLAPMVVVEPIDFAKKYEKERSTVRSKDSLLSEGRRGTLSAITFSEYIARETKNRLLKVEGKQWEEFYKNVIAVRQGENPGKEWTKRLPNERHPLRMIYFKPDEPPLNSVTQNLKSHLDTLYLVLGEEKKEYLKVEYKKYSNADFMIGSGFAPYPDPPSFLLYPYRKFSLWLILIGIAFYVLLPRPKSDPKALRYPLWRVILGDVFALLMIVPFFIIPIFVVGGSKQSLTEGWLLIIFFWPICLFGIWTLLKVSTWMAAYRILLLNDRLQIVTPKGSREFAFNEMESFQPVIFKPPRWLIITLWIAALSGKGAQRMGGVGRALMAEGSEYGSTAIKLKDGATVYIHVTDAMGSVMLKGVEKIIDALKGAGVKEEKEIKEIRSLGFDTITLPER